MKSKATTYLLIAVVFAVWGVIVWKIFFQKNQPQPQLRAAHAPKAQPVEEADTLWLDYRDPFLGKLQVAPPKVTRQLRALPPPAPKPKPYVKHNVKYIGSISRCGKLYCLVEINNVQHTLLTSETMEDYRLDAIYEDSVRFVFDGDPLTFKRSK